MIRRHRLFFIMVLVLTLVVLGLTAYFMVNINEAPVDMVEVNRVRSEINKGKMPENCLYNFLAIDSDGKNMYGTAEYPQLSYSARINDAIKAGDAVVDWDYGKIIFETGFHSRLHAAQRSAYTTVLLLIFACFFVFLWETFYLDRRIFRPFNQLKCFSEEVAKGNFDRPLRMDRNNNFGAFTEAFDLMRTNLQAARIAEKEALDSKRQLLAELGHDIKTPVASILAVAELQDARGMVGMGVIIAKAKQIDKLLTDIYNISLENIGQLRVEKTEHPAHEIKDIILAADFAGAAIFLSEPPSMNVIYDEMRFAECVDNILMNANKYANGKLYIEFGILNERFFVSFQDNGAGADAEELAFITDKFFRGKAANNKTGTGLGLYITKNLLEKMGGAMTAENANGLKITFFLQQK